MFESSQMAFGAVAFLIALAMTPLVRMLAIKNGWVARPREDRWHKKATALMGGIAIFLAIAVTIWIAGDLHSFFGKPVLGEPGKPLVPLSVAVIFCGTAFLFLLGLADDFITLKPPNQAYWPNQRGQCLDFSGFPAELVFVPDLGHHGDAGLDRRHHQCL